jgi:sugar/nucleoside kinase (ribokinase family)
MCQNEIMMEATIAAMRIAATSNSTKSIFNPAPAPEDGVLPAEIYSLSDIFVVNETESELMTKVKCMVRVFRQGFTFQNAIGSHMCPLEARACV